MRISAIIIVAILVSSGPGCHLIRSIADEVPEPPSVTANCEVPVGDPYLAGALSDELLTSLDGVPSDPEGALAYFETKIRAAGFELRHKRGDGPEAHRSTTIPGAVLLDVTYEEQDSFDKAVLLSHEYVHVAHYNELGDAVFLSRYTFSMGRIAAELPAYRMGYRMRRHLGSTPGIEDYKRRAASFHADYSIGVPLVCVEKWSIEAWDEAA